jgi:hypothetical protein
VVFGLAIGGLENWDGWLVWGGGLKEGACYVRGWIGKKGGINAGWKVGKEDIKDYSKILDLVCTRE